MNWWRNWYMGRHTQNALLVKAPAGLAWTVSEGNWKHIILYPRAFLFTTTATDIGHYNAWILWMILWNLNECSGITVQKLDEFWRLIINVWNAWRVGACFQGGSLFGRWGLVWKVGACFEGGDWIVLKAGACRQSGSLFNLKGLDLNVGACFEDGAYCFEGGSLF